MELDELFKQCKFSRRYQGYNALRECLRIVLEDEESLLYMTGIYAEAAKRCHVSWTHVERNIRTMLDNSWKNGGKEPLEMIAGEVLYTKPTVGEVIESLTYYLKAHSKL